MEGQNIPDEGTNPKIHQCIEWFIDSKSKPKNTWQNLDLLLVE